MAELEEKDFSSSVKGSDYVFEFVCDPCSNDGQTVEALNYCVDCCEHFCAACTKHHNRFRGTSDHNVVNSKLASGASGLSKTSSPLIKETCREHSGEKLTTYCADHDVVICNTCVSVDHRLCGGISYIPKVAGGPNQMQDNAEIHKQITKSLGGIDKTKQSLQAVLASADGEQEEHIERIHDYTERLIEHARDMEESAISEVKQQYEKVTDKLRSGVESLDEASATLKARQNRTKNTQANSDSQVFVDIKMGKEEMARVRNIQQKIKPLLSVKAMPEYVIREGVDSFLNEIVTLGQFVEKSNTYKAVLFGEYDVKMSDDLRNCRIGDSCVLADDSVLIADFGNTSLKKLDSSFSVTECLQLPSSPYSICQTSNDEVAVTLCLTKSVQFVNFRGQLKLSRSFSVGNICRGISFIQNELFVACGKENSDKGFVGVYDINGTCLRTLKCDQEGRQIVSIPHHIAATENGDKIHISDYYHKRGVITVDKQGNVLSRLSDGALNGADGLCVLADGTVFVCGAKSDNVLQIDSTGKKMATLLQKEDKIKEPSSVHILNNSAQIIITEDHSNTIKIYNF